MLTNAKLAVFLGWVRLAALKTGQFKLTVSQQPSAGQGSPPAACHAGYAAHPAANPPEGEAPQGRRPADQPVTLQEPPRWQRQQQVPTLEPPVPQQGCNAPACSWERQLPRLQDLHGQLLAALASCS